MIWSIVFGYWKLVLVLLIFTVFGRLVVWKGRKDWETLTDEFDLEFLSEELQPFGLVYQRK
jgi:hypothetical protein